MVGLWVLLGLRYVLVRMFRGMFVVFCLPVLFLVALVLCGFVVVGLCPMMLVRIGTMGIQKALLLRRLSSHMRGG